MGHSGRYCFVGHWGRNPQISTVPCTTDILTFLLGYSGNSHLWRSRSPYLGIPGRFKQGLVALFMFFSPSIEKMYEWDPRQRSVVGLNIDTDLFCFTDLSLEMKKAAELVFYWNMAAMSHNKMSTKCPSVKFASKLIKLRCIWLSLGDWYTCTSVTFKVSRWHFNLAQYI